MAALDAGVVDVVVETVTFVSFDANGCLGINSDLEQLTIFKVFGQQNFKKAVLVFNDGKKCKVQVCLILTPLPVEL